ncbi:MAG TPA: ATP-grasp domain-containing protein [Candidatus Polarisedimenticolaceae bacterium]|nr:ATP-grasp domain-containing protein [Candidatus Polarisedimenticolaceae bacterium]
MNVLMISPGYPGQMPYFTRGLAAVGARTFGVGDQPDSALAHDVRRALVAYLQVPDLWDEQAVVRRVLDEARSHELRFDRVECLWEPGMILAARLRQALDARGMRVEQTVPFRDKEVMKQLLDRAGIRTPWHARCTTGNEVRAAVARVGYPAIVKPIAGAGATDTHRVDDDEQLALVIASVGHVPEVSVEEFIAGDEYTHDTICAGGRMLYENVARYTTKPIEERKHQWVSPGSVCLREIDAAELAGGRQMGRRVLAALGFRTGFTHMEWFRKPDGEIVFGEIAARPAGAHLIEVMNFASDVDLFRGWAEAVVHGRLSQPIERRYNAALIGKRARGSGRIVGSEGLDRLRHELGSALCKVQMNPVGTPAGDWKRGAPADGFAIVRHPDLPTTLELAARVAREWQIQAG